MLQHHSPVGGGNNSSPGATKELTYAQCLWFTETRGEGVRQAFQQICSGTGAQTGQPSSKLLPATLLFPFVGLKRASKYLDRPFPNDHMCVGFCPRGRVEPSVAWGLAGLGGSGKAASEPLPRCARSFLHLRFAMCVCPDTRMLGSGWRSWAGHRDGGHPLGGEDLRLNPGSVS